MSSRKVLIGNLLYEGAMENLARYIVRASFFQERTTYVKEESKVVYRSKGDKNQKIFTYPRILISPHSIR